MKSSKLPTSPFLLSNAAVLSFEEIKADKTKLMRMNSCTWHMKFFLEIRQTHIVRWLLDHEPSHRPTAQELLQSDYLPPPQMEEAELNEVLR